jgi:hypothetical protein
MLSVLERKSNDLLPPNIEPVLRTFDAEFRPAMFDQEFEVVYDNANSMLFSIIDLLCNLDSILRYFPYSNKRYLLESPLVYKRLILFYFKLRENIEHRWTLGAI